MKCRMDRMNVNHYINEGVSEMNNMLSVFGYHNYYKKEILESITPFESETNDHSRKVNAFTILRQ